MSDVSNRTRVQAGVPTGGEFAREQRGENGDLLVERDWGKVKPLSRYLGVEVDVVDEIAPGILYVGTPSHGCYRLSPERNMVVPAALRQRSGTYNEDDGACVVQMYFPEDFTDTAEEAVALRDSAAQRVMDHLPDAYTKATGVTLSPSDSYVLRQRASDEAKDAFKAEHASEFVTENHSISAPALVPEGFKVRTASKASTGEERYFLERDDREEGSPRNEAPVRVIDPDQAIDITDLVAKREAFYRPTHPLLTGDAVKLDPTYAHAGNREKAQIDKDLNTAYRFREDDGRITNETMLERFARKGVTGKKISEVSNRATTQYEVLLDDGRFQAVSKAAYDALQIPDLTTEDDRNRNTFTASQRNLDKAHKEYQAASAGRNWDALKAKKAALDAAQTAHAQVSTVTENKRLARYVEFQSMEATLGAEAQRRANQFISEE